MVVQQRRISSQHRQLDELHAAVARALARDTIHLARDAFQRLQDAVLAHLSLEEELYLPALETLRPALREHLAALREEHEPLRSRLRTLRALLEVNERELSGRRLEELAEALTTHEQREERLIADLAGATQDAERPGS